MNLPPVMNKMSEYSARLIESEKGKDDIATRAKVVLIESGEDPMRAFITTMILVTAGDQIMREQADEIAKLEAENNNLRNLI